MDKTKEPKMIVVRGKPAPQGSKVSTRFGGMREASQFVMPWRNRRNEGNLKPSAPTYPITRSTGDIDKLCRSTLDGLSIPSGGILLRDDSLVVELKAKKSFAAKGGFQGAFIHIWQL